MLQMNKPTIFACCWQQIIFQRKTVWNVVTFDDQSDPYAFNDTFEKSVSDLILKLLSVPYFLWVLAWCNWYVWVDGNESL